VDARGFFFGVRLAVRIAGVFFLDFEPYVRKPSGQMPTASLFTKGDLAQAQDLQP